MWVPKAFPFFATWGFPTVSCPLPYDFTVVSSFGDVTQSFTAQRTTYRIEVVRVGLSTVSAFPDLWTVFTVGEFAMLSSVPRVKGFSSTVTFGGPSCTYSWCITSSFQRSTDIFSSFFSTLRDSSVRPQCDRSVFERSCTFSLFFPFFADMLCGTGLCHSVTFSWRCNSVNSSFNYFYPLGL